MLYKYYLKLKPTSNPYMTTIKFAEILRRDDTLSPMSEAMLKALRKKRATYFDLPLALEVTIDTEKHITLTRNINPSAKVPTLDKWSENNIKEYNKNPSKFIKNILKLYEKDFGMEIIEMPIEQSEVDISLKELEKRAERALKRIQRLSKNDNK